MSRLRSKAELFDIEKTLSWLQNAPEDIPGAEEAFKEYKSERHRKIAATFNVCNFKMLALRSIDSEFGFARETAILPAGPILSE